MNDLATALLNRIEATKSEDRRVTVTLDAETVRLVERWRLENLATTVRFMLRIADEQLTGLKGGPGSRPERGAQSH